eukprot:501608-Rhodomonas_salina.2
MSLRALYAMRSTDAGLCYQAAVPGNTPAPTSTPVSSDRDLDLAGAANDDDDVGGPLCSYALATRAVYALTQRATRGLCGPMGLLPDARY